MKRNIGWRALILVAVLGVMFTFMGVRDTIKLSKDPINMDITDWGTLEAGDHVQVTIDMIWGQFYTETTEETTLGITTSSRESGRGYAIPHLYVDNQGFYNIEECPPFIAREKVSSKGLIPSIARICGVTGSEYSL